jgi:inner membrane protein
MNAIVEDRTPGAKLVLVIAVAFLLSFPLFAVWLIVYDRQSQSEFAQQSIAEGWGGPQAMSGPVLVIPYTSAPRRRTRGNGERHPLRRDMHELTLAPEIVELTTDVRPGAAQRSIYEAVVYDAAVRGRARFAFPQDLARLGVAPARLDFARAELRFGSPIRAGSAPIRSVRAGGQPLRLQPGGGAAAAARLLRLARRRASERPIRSISPSISAATRALSLAPQAGETRWRLRSSWPHPSFQGGFLPAGRERRRDGFDAELPRRQPGARPVAGQHRRRRRPAPAAPERSVPPPTREPMAATARRPPRRRRPAGTAQISLIQPVDLYSQVNRATKYGFLFIGFTFLALLMFDVIGGVRVSAVEYLLMGAALVLFFVLLLAFAEVIGFTPPTSSRRRRSPGSTPPIRRRC